MDVKGQNNAHSERYYKGTIINILQHKEEKKSFTRFKTMDYILKNRKDVAKELEEQITYYI